MFTYSCQRKTAHSCQCKGSELWDVNGWMNGIDENRFIPITRKVCNYFLALSCVCRARESACCPGTVHQKSWSSSHWLWATTSPLHRQMDFLTGSGPPAHRLKASVHSSLRYSNHCMCLFVGGWEKQWKMESDTDKLICAEMLLIMWLNVKRARSCSL